MPGGEARRRVEHGELAELDEMVAASARAELPPGAVLHPCRHPRDTPVGIHDVVLPAFLEGRTHSEACLPLDGLGQAAWSVDSAWTGRSSTVSFIRQAMSTPTAYGMTASRVARTPPIGSP